MKLIDSIAQLRIVLHLYNAFIQVGGIEIGELPFLDWLYDTFKCCKAIWEGPVPKKGEFVKLWWISYGKSIQYAQHLATEKHTQCRGSTDSNATTIRLQPRLKKWYRDLTPFKAQDISESFRRVCLHDFAGLKDQHRADSQMRQHKGSLMHEWAVQSNATMDAMEREQRLLASNFIVIGSKLSEFIVKLFDVLEWTPKIDQIMAGATPSVKNSVRRVNGKVVHPKAWKASDTNTMRQYVMFEYMVEGLFAPLDVTPTWKEISDYNPDRLIPRSVASLRDYFKHISPSEVLFFSPTTFSGDDEWMDLKTKISDAKLIGT